MTLFVSDSPWQWLPSHSLLGALFALNQWLRVSDLPTVENCNRYRHVDAKKLVHSRITLNIIWLTTRVSILVFCKSKTLKSQYLGPKTVMNMCSFHYNPMTAVSAWLGLVRCMQYIHSELYIYILIQHSVWCQAPDVTCHVVPVCIVLHICIVYTACTWRDPIRPKPLRDWSM